MTEVPNRIAEVTPENLAEAARQCVGHEVVTAVGPASLADELTAAGVVFERVP